METTPKPGLTVGPATNHLLQSLRALEQAREHYCLAVEAFAGEQAADKATAQAAPTFDAVADLIKTEIIAAVQDWATTTTEQTEI